MRGRSLKQKRNNIRIVLFLETTRGLSREKGNGVEFLWNGRVEDEALRALFQETI
jgi:hypothetical protein